MIMNVYPSLVPHFDSYHFSPFTSIFQNQWKWHDTGPVTGMAVNKGSMSNAHTWIWHCALPGRTRVFILLWEAQRKIQENLRVSK